MCYYWFNNNIRCIEILEGVMCDKCFVKFNNNIRCIEILIATNQKVLTMSV